MLRDILKANLFTVLSKSIVHVQVSLLLVFSRILSQHLLTKGVYAKAQRMLQLVKYLIKGYLSLLLFYILDPDLYFNIL